MENRTINFNGKTYKQIQKRTAKRIFDNKKTVYVISCNANPNSPWINGFYALGWDELLKHDDFIPEYDFDFEKRVNEYEYYNCNSELGNYSHFYIISE